MKIGNFSSAMPVRGSLSTKDPKKIRLSLSIEKMLTASELMVYVTIKFFFNCTKCMFNMLLFTGSMSNYFSAVVGLATVFVNYVNLV